MSTSSSSLETGDEKLFFDDDGHLAFAPNDSENPKNFSFMRKCYITAVTVVVVLNCTLASSAPSGNIKGISKAFHVSDEVAGLVTTLFLLGYCAGPLFWAPLSEFYGRRLIFLGSFTAYIALGFLPAFTPNLGELLAGRFLTGTFASCALTNAPGVLGDIWGPIPRRNSMM